MKNRGQIITPLHIRLQRSSLIDPKTGCWNWQLSKVHGYGHMVIGSRTDKTRKHISAHRVSYLVFKGPIPEGMEVCHHCDNPSCVNPEHLFVGTRQDNIDDRESKGRNNPPFGEHHPQAKLDTEKVLAIRELGNKGLSHRKLAKIFGVHKSTITRVLNNIHWAHVIPAAPLADSGKKL